MDEAFKFLSRKHGFDLNKDPELERAGLYKCRRYYLIINVINHWR